MPFHPWCFDIFCRQSKARFNRINIPGLMTWRNAEFSYSDFRKFPRSEDVRKSRDQFWQHLPGKEYLAANPLYVPGLPTILLNAAKKEEDLSHGGIEESELLKRPHASLLIGRDDVFDSMPLEICLLIVSFLNGSDLNSLRIVSKTFTRLPNSVWHQLVREEMPWLWESCDDGKEVHVPSFWTAVTKSSLKLFKEEREHYSLLLEDVYTPTSEVVDFLLPFPKEVPNQLQLSRRNTNWHGVYTQIKKSWSSLRGATESTADLERCERDYQAD
ncbi:hypothetical protein N7481_007283 [Penicillium waksmanii]|uniref:uncharacterized protein n=1 Tax=Penicillium waksmanii TaxID=69791 RepID=UPI002547A473|nr:uncharacterized protein N7481_007283 [Penicillium waksmanii]KAJ5979985.1 hypothetical protein N7481_007283 [Penicillium waksmanii]